MTKIFIADFSRKFYIPAEFDILLLFSPSSAEDDSEFRFRTQYLTKLPEDLEETSEVVSRLPEPLEIIESQLPPSALTEITAAEMLGYKVDWDGNRIEEAVVEEKEAAFSLVSILLISMIFVVVLVIAYINRKLLIAKFK